VQQRLAHSFAVGLVQVMKEVDLVILGSTEHRRGDEYRRYVQ
jgi:hypothetical protein